MSATEPSLIPHPDWDKIVDVPQRYHKRGIDLEKDPQSRAISIHQLESLGRLILKVLRKKYYPKKMPDGKDKDGKDKWRTVGQLTKININMYEINNIFTSPLSKTNECSYVEMIATKPQNPNFFVSHFWGTSFFDTLSMLKLHAKQRNLSETDNYYWICTFANNQHKLELNTYDAGYTNTPFYRALFSDSCEGTLLLLDEFKATPFTRIWCVFELYMTTVISKNKSKSKGLLFDVGTIIPSLECENRKGEKNLRCAGVLLEDSKGRQTSRLQDDFCEDSKELAELQDEFREDLGFTDHPGGSDRAWFPARVSKLGFLTDVREGKASYPEDEEWIKNIIKGNEDEVNLAVHRKLYRSAANQSATALGSFRMLEYVLNKKVVSKELSQKLFNEDGIVADTAAFGHRKERNDCLLYLLDYRCDANGVSKEGEHPLVRACATRNHQHVSILLHYGSDPDFKHADGTTLDKQIGDSGVMKILRHYKKERGADFKPADRSPSIGNLSNIKKEYKTDGDAKMARTALGRRWGTGSFLYRVNSLFTNLN